MNDATVEFPGESPPIGADPHVVNTVYDFTWPEGGLITSLLNSTDSGSQGLLASPFCAYVVQSDIAQNVSDLYQQSDAGSCVSMLGQDCVDSITSALSSGVGDECAPPPSITTLDACAGAFPDMDILSFGTSAHALRSEDLLLTCIPSAHKQRLSERERQHHQYHHAATR